MARMTGGQALVKSLYAEGVRVIFGIPGVQLYDAMDALYDEPRIRFITTRHEQAAAYMADGFSRAGGDVGTVFVVPGPGLMNASAAIGTAYASSSPILVVSGQIPRGDIGAGLGHLHEVDDQLEVMKPVTKWAKRINQASDIPTIVHEAFYHLKTGRPKPVEIELSPETLNEEADITIIDVEEYDQVLPSKSTLIQAAKALLLSSNPAILAGSSTVFPNISGPLLKIAEFLQAPVYTTREGKGAISDRHYLSAGGPSFRSEALEDKISHHDAILGIGARLGKFDFSETNCVVHIDIDEQELKFAPQDTIYLEGNVVRTLDTLAQTLTKSAPARPVRKDELEPIRSLRFEPACHVEPQGSFVRSIRSSIPDDGIVVEGVTQIGYASNMLYPVFEPGTYFTSSYFGNLGYAYPTALGAKVAQPDRAVVCITGDGGFLYNSQELATAVMYGINAVVIVFNDNAYGNVLRDQKIRYNNRVIGSKLHNPDFVQLAQAYGAHGVKVKKPNQLESELTKALESNIPTLIEVPLGTVPVPY